MESSDQVASEMMGELIAYRVAVLTLIASHPEPSRLQERLKIAEESGSAIILAEPHPDETLDAFQRAMRAINALLPPQS